MTDSDRLADIISTLNEVWQPHPGQIPMGSSLFYQNCKNIFGQCGRNWGKTEFIAYATSRWAKQFPGSENYIFEPLQKQAKEILWASGRLQSMVPEDWITGINNTEMRISFRNGSFIKLDGSDNFDAYRGVKPKGLSVFDEIKDIKKQFLDAYEPNRGAYDSPGIFIGTPPEFHNHYIDLVEVAKQSDEWAYFHGPTSQNPYISANWLARKKAELFLLNDEETWFREYEAVFVKGGKRHILPQALKYIPRPRQELTPKSFKHWELNVIFDPAAASVFGVGFILFNKYSRHSIFFDEIYEKDQGLMTVRTIWDQVFEKLDNIRDIGFRGDITYIYDEAETWFMNESYEYAKTKGLYLQPTRKSITTKEDGIALIRDVYNKQLIDIAQECKMFIWEQENYIKDDHGRIPKKNDHLIDIFRYHLEAIGYSITDQPVPKEADPLTEKRFTRLEDDLTFNSMQEMDLAEDMGSMEEM